MRYGDRYRSVRFYVADPAETTRCSSTTYSAIFSTTTTSSMSPTLPSKSWDSAEIQVAGFHPQYQLADTDPDDIKNQSLPYPTLHAARGKC
jgi:hypothetical protein